MRQREQNRYIFAPEGKRHRERNHRFRNTVLFLLPILLIAFFISNFIVSHSVNLDRVNLTVLNLPDDLEQYSILHLSDLHGAELGEKQKAMGRRGTPAS